MGLNIQNSKPFYKIYEREAALVGLNFILYLICLFLIALPLSIFGDGWVCMLGISSSIFLVWLMQLSLFFNYAEIYEDRIVINRFAFKDTIIKAEDLEVGFSIFMDDFMPDKVWITWKRKYFINGLFVIIGLNPDQSDEMLKELISLKDRSGRENIKNNEKDDIFPEILSDRIGLQSKNESQDKAEVVLYRLDKRNPFFVIQDFTMSAFLFVLTMLFLICDNKFLQVIGILLTVFSIWFLCSLLFFNYIEIYEDRIVIGRFLFKDTIINAEEIDYCYVFSHTFSPEHVQIAKKKKGLFRKMYIITSLTFRQANDISSNVFSVKIQ
ncbi:hypothetical protein [Campylobacter sp. CCUG 57310]|uniref:hypothetical protein n=1 Tax=Campylobacter sp. CCUG 57310 TaxID=2517362 RepID=UPI0015668648|nr:hypothetical protein [Campylobacter sp. CCUG 57310]QKF92251.1 putative membrane protein [Campylobacter sp. CCUG 57310]